MPPVAPLASSASRTSRRWQTSAYSGRNALCEVAARKTSETSAESCAGVSRGSSRTCAEMDSNFSSVSLLRRRRAARLTSSAAASNSTSRRGETAGEEAGEEILRRVGVQGGSGHGGSSACAGVPGSQSEAAEERQGVSRSSVSAPDAAAVSTSTSAPAQGEQSGTPWRPWTIMRRSCCSSSFSSNSSCPSSLARCPRLR
mmetsp:Transcript_21411/g.63905  ORF Transcript_21411/g.63905 Transcript_21411/m.63905 type:complete len:200 (+) Transcript_21411:564-1163(+)